MDKKELVEVLNSVKWKYDRAQNHIRSETVFDAANVLTFATNATVHLGVSTIPQIQGDVANLTFSGDTDLRKLASAGVNFPGSSNFLTAKAK